MKRRNRCLVVVALALALIAWSATVFAEDARGGVPEGFFEGASLRNGAAIFLDGANARGERMRFEGGPPWLGMHGGGCASCHGENGRGGYVPMMCSGKTPDITLKALLGGGHEAGEPPYTVPTIRRALERALDPGGGRLDPCMPRWFLGADDFRDLLFYLRSLGG